jgi:hypothetical protein
MLKIIKRKINILGTITLLLETSEDQQLKVIDAYENNGQHDMHIFLAQKPQNKYFKQWKHIAWRLPNEDNWNTLEEMYIDVVASALARYECERNIQLKRLEKFKNFKKTLDK